MKEVLLFLNSKTGKYVLIGIGVLITGLILRKQIKKLFDRTYDIGAISKELKQVTVKDYNVTLTDSEATLITQNIFNAMNKWGTDEDVIIRNLEKLQTKDDLLLIIKKFGVKPYNGTSMTVSKIRKSISSRDLNLNGWLQAELSGDYLKHVLDIYTKLNVDF